MLEYGLLGGELAGGGLRDMGDLDYWLHSLTNGPTMWWVAGGLVLISVVFWFMR